MALSPPHMHTWVGLAELPVAVAEPWGWELGSEPLLSWPSAPTFCLSSVFLLSGFGGQGPKGAVAFPDAEPLPA